MRKETIRDVHLDDGFHVKLGGIGDSIGVV